MPIHDLKPESSLIIVKAESLRLRLRKKSKVTLESRCVAQNVELFQEITLPLPYSMWSGINCFAYYLHQEDHVFSCICFFSFLCIWLVG